MAVLVRTTSAAVHAKVTPPLKLASLVKVAC